MNISFKKTTVIAYVSFNLETVKDVVRQMSKKSGFRRNFDKQHAKRIQTLLKSPGQHLYDSHWSLWIKLSWKKSFFVICKILGLFFNTLTADGKYSILNRDNLTQTIQMEFSQKRKTFFPLFFAFLKSRLNFEHILKRMTLTSYLFQELQTAKDVVRQMSKRWGFGRSFHKQHGKRSQTLLKSEDQHLFHIYWSLLSRFSWEKSLLVISAMENNQSRYNYLRKKNFFPILFYIFEI